MSDIDLPPLFPNPYAQLEYLRAGGVVPPWPIPASRLQLLDALLEFAAAAERDGEQLCPRVYEQWLKELTQ